MLDVVEAGVVKPRGIVGTVAVARTRVKPDDNIHVHHRIEEAAFLTVVDPHEILHDDQPAGLQGVIGSAEYMAAIVFGFDEHHAGDQHNIVVFLQVDGVHIAFDERNPILQMVRLDQRLGNGEGFFGIHHIRVEVGVDGTRQTVATSRRRKLPRITEGVR